MVNPSVANLPRDAPWHTPTGPEKFHRPTLLALPPHVATRAPTSPLPSAHERFTTVPQGRPFVASLTTRLSPVSVGHVMAAFDRQRSALARARDSGLSVRTGTRLAVCAQGEARGAGAFGRPNQVTTRLAAVEVVGLSALILVCACARRRSGESGTDGVAGPRGGVGRRLTRARDTDSCLPTGSTAHRSGVSSELEAVVAEGASNAPEDHTLKLNSTVHWCRGYPARSVCDCGSAGLPVELHMHAITHRYRSVRPQRERSPRDRST